MAGIGLAIRGAGKVLSKFVKKKKPSNFIERSREKLEKRIKRRETDKTLGKALGLAAGLSTAGSLRYTASQFDKNKNKDK